MRRGRRSNSDDPADAHPVRAAALVELGGYAGVIDWCDVALTQGPPSAELYRVRGLARTRRGDSPGAIDDSTRALDRQPGTAGAIVEPPGRGLARAGCRRTGAGRPRPAHLPATTASVDSLRPRAATSGPSVNPLRDRNRGAQWPGCCSSTMTRS
jgi:hypothetical protein